MQTIHLVSPRSHRLAGFATNERGNILVMMALIVLVLLLAPLGATTLMTALGKRQHLQAIAQVACNRAVKPLRMTTMSDATCKTRAEDLFDELAKDRCLTIGSRTVTTDWLESRAVAKAMVAGMIRFGKQAAVTIAADALCAGIPPYPAVRHHLVIQRQDAGRNQYFPPQFGWGTWEMGRVFWTAAWLGRRHRPRGGDSGLDQWHPLTTKAYLPAGVSNPTSLN